MPTHLGHGSIAATDASSPGTSSYAFEPFGKLLPICSTQHRLGIGSFILFQCKPHFYFTTPPHLRSPTKFLIISFTCNSWRNIPSQLVLNPEPHFRAMSHPTPTAEMPPPPSMIHRPDGTGTIHPGNTFHVRSRASSASTSHRMPPASSINPQQASSSAHPDIRSSKRQRVATMMETPARCGEATVDPSSPPAPPTPAGPS